MLISYKFSHVLSKQKKISEARELVKESMLSAIESLCEGSRNGRNCAAD
jgi:hypothetical protein